MNADDTLLLTVEAAARRLGMSRGAIYPLVMSREIPSLKIGRSRRIPVAALEAWVEAQTEREGTKLGVGVIPDRRP